MVIGRGLSRFVFVVSIFFHVYLSAVQYGSLTTTSVLSTVTFPAADTDNAVLAFGWLRNGFVFENSSVSCNFASVYPVAGNIALNGGALYLQEDLIVSDAGMITGGGRIIGNNHTIWMNSDSQFEAAKTYTLQNLTLEINADLSLGSTLIFQGDCQLSGENAPVWLNEPWQGSGAGMIVVSPNSWLYVYGIYLHNIVGNNILCSDNSSAITLRDSKWRQSGNFTFALGTLNFYHSVEMMGNATFAYQSGMVSTILYESSLQLDQGFTFSYDPVVVASQNLIQFEDATSTLVLNGATLHATTTGLALKIGALQVLQYSVLESEQNMATYTGGGITLGDGAVGTNDMSLIISPAATLRVNTGTLYYNNITAAALQFLNVSSSLYINSGVTLRLLQSMSLGTGFVVFANGASLFRDTGKIIIGSVQPLGTLSII